MLYDVFICHASEDKEPFVRPLAESLQEKHVEVWFDEFSLKLGDSIRRSIDKGLRQSRFGVVVLSPAFFEKNWPQYELDGLVSREMKGKDKIILPIWHNVSDEDVTRYSPALAGRKAVSSVDGIQHVVKKVLDVIHPNNSPLIVARDMLLDKGITPPVITDKYWLEVVEASNRVPGFGAVVSEESSWNRWSFPLPPKETGATQWGERLAWTAMQMNWVKTGEEVPITPLTPPEEVLNFIYTHIGLFETCLIFPVLLAEYAPQLTIPGFGGGLEETIAIEYEKSCAERQQRRIPSKFGSALTMDQESPLCGKDWALRHPTFGNYEPAHIANAYFSGDIFGPSVSPYEHTDHAFWLLSSASSWLPRRVHSFLLEGMISWRVWPWAYDGMDKGPDRENNGALFRALHDAIEGKSFTWSRRTKDDLRSRIELSIETLGLPGLIQDRFIVHDFVGRWIGAEQTRRKHSRNQNARGLKRKKPGTPSS